jgi:hypothetical protein
MDITALYYALLAIGFLLLLVPPAIPSVAGQTLGGTSYATQVFLPTTTGLLLLLFAYYGLYKDTYNEYFWQVLIALTAAGGILLSLVASGLSLTRMRWMSD